MTKRTDPLVPILASSVAFVVVGAIVLVFYPRVRDLIGPEKDSVVGVRASEQVGIPVWLCQSEEGVAMMIEPCLDEDAARVLGAALEGGPYHFLRLGIYNFDRETPFVFRIPEAGLSSPEGGSPACATAALLRSEVPAYLRTVLDGLGAVQSIEVGKGSSAQALLAVKESPGKRTAFVSGHLRFERRLIQRLRLESWRVHPAYQDFKDF